MANRGIAVRDFPDDFFLEIPAMRLIFSLLYLYDIHSPTSSLSCSTANTHNHHAR